MNHRYGSRSPRNPEGDTTGIPYFFIVVMAAAALVFLLVLGVI